jgi:hypothetical protein
MRIMDKTISPKGFILAGNATNVPAMPGSPHINMDDKYTVLTNGGFEAVQKWVSIAVTYDGTKAANNVKVYRGYRTGAEADGAGNEALQLLYTTTMDAGPLADNSMKFVHWKYADEAAAIRWLSRQHSTARHEDGGQCGGGAERRGTGESAVLRCFVVPRSGRDVDYQ